MWSCTVISTPQPVQCYAIWVCMNGLSTGQEVNQRNIFTIPPPQKKNTLAMILATEHDCLNVCGFLSEPATYSGMKCEKPSHFLLWQSVVAFQKMTEQHPCVSTCVHLWAFLEPILHKYAFIKVELWQCHKLLMDFGRANISWVQEMNHWTCFITGRISD
jgi:hypothetical protein